ncbi:MAG: glycogen synthase [Fusobacteriaceae bacterium]
MKVLYVANDVFPFVKSDESSYLSAALPKYINRTGEAEVRVILPNCLHMDSLFRKNFKNIGDGSIVLDSKKIHFWIEHLKYMEINYYLVVSGEDVPYSSEFFSRAVLQSFNIIKFHPDIIHCNHVSSAPIPALLSSSKIKTVFTVYNESPLLESALAYSDSICTVKNFPELSKLYKTKMLSVRNSIDIEVFDPKKDSEIEFNYGYTSIIQRKSNKLQLQKELGLFENRDIPVIAVIGKLDRENGMDLILQNMDSIMSEKVEMIFLGSGDEKYEDFFDYYAHIYPDKVYTQEFRSDFLTKKILSGADIIITPESGITHMLALRYGAVPVSLFCDNTLTPLEWALNSYRHEPTNWLKTVEKGMRANHSCSIPVKKYLSLYKNLLEK